MSFQWALVKEQIEKNLILLCVDNFYTNHPFQSHVYCLERDKIVCVFPYIENLSYQIENCSPYISSEEKDQNHKTAPKSRPSVKQV